MSITWLKFHHDARRDAKLSALTDAQHRVWVHSLLYASEQEGDRGTIPPMKERLLALEIAGGDVEKMRDALAAMADLDLIVIADDGAITFRAFAKRNARKASDEPEAIAARRARAKQKNAGEENTDRDQSRSLALDKEKDLEESHDHVRSGEPDANESEEESVEAVEAPPSYPEDFEAFWLAYPRRRRQNKVAGLRAWRNAKRRGATAEAVMTGLAKAKASKDWAKDGGDFVPMPSSWLNAGGYESEYEAASGDAPTVSDLPSEVASRSWLDAIRPHLATKGLTIAAVLNFAIAIKADLAETKRRFNADGPVAAADWAWANRKETT